MPTFFGRRYMRDSAPPTERAIGVVCLLLTAGIVAAFVRYAMVSRQPFFSVDPALEPKAVPIEVKLARSLLPDHPAPGWVRAEPVQGIPASAMARSMPDLAPKFVKAGARWMYEAHFSNRADARQQLTVQVIDMGTPAAARTAFDAARPADAVGEPVGLRGWRAKDGTVGFQSGRYMSRISANAPARDATLTPTLLAREAADRQVAYDAAAPSQTAASSTPGTTAKPKEELLPRIPGGQWSPADQIATYDPANLWEKIDGRAEQYLAFDFERLVFGTYRLTDASAAVDCFVYRMKDATKAFGMYQTERSEHATRVDVGKDGYRGVGSLYFLKGRHYVQLVAAEGAKIADDTLLSLARALAAWLPEESGGMWAEQTLPTKNRTPNSFTYYAANAFNLDFLKDTFAADYESGKNRWTLFIHRAADDAGARKLLTQYEQYVSKLGRVVEHPAADGSGFLVGDISGEYDIIFVKGRYFGGVTGGSDRAICTQRAGELRDALK